MTSAYSADTATFLAIGLILVLSVMTCTILGRRQSVLAPTLFSLTLHAGASAWAYASWGLFSPDAIYYDEVASSLLGYWNGTNSSPITVTMGKQGFPLALASLYWMVGHHPIVGILCNATMVSLLVPIISSTSRLCKLDASGAAWITATFPPFVFWGGLLLREATSWLLLSLIVRGLVGLLRESKASQRKNILLMIPALLALFAIRGTASILVGTSIVIAFSLAGRSRFRPITLCVAGVALTLVVMSPPVSRLLASYNLETTNQSRAGLSRSASTAFETQAYDSFGGMILAIPKSTLRGLFGPFPWELSSGGLLLACDALIWWALIICCYIGWKRATDRQILWALILPSMSVIVALSLTSGNYGTMIRLRYQAAVMLMPLAASLLSRPRLSNTEDLAAHMDVSHSK